MAPPYEALGRTVEIEGRDVYIDCRGSGDTTVILEAGFGSGAGSWGAVFDEIATFARVCSWDRPGLGRSAPRGLHSAAEAARDLRAALATAGERGPFVVVAHSLGGVYARLFADPQGGAPAPGEQGPGRPPSDAVLGFVMLDTYEPDLGVADDPSLPEDLRAAVQRSLDETGAMLQNGEDLDWARTLDELASAGPVTLPATLLTVDPRARYGDPDPARKEALVDAWYRAIARRYPNADLEITNTGHMVHLERPDLVVIRTRELVERLARRQ